MIAALLALSLEILSVHGNDEIEQCVVSRRAACHAGVQRVGEKLFFPLVVTGYRARKGRMSVGGEAKFIDPKGKVLATFRWKPRVEEDPRLPGTVVLVPVLHLTPDPDDPRGHYLLRATVRDNLAHKTARAEEPFEVIP